MTIPPDNAASVQHALRRRTAVTRGVTAVTQIGAVAALTSTGAVVGVLAHHAQLADAQKQAARTPPPRVVLVKPVTRPVRTVVVRRPAATAPAPQRSVRSTSSAPRRTTAAVRRTTTARTTTTRSAPAPKATQAPAATTTSGS